MLNKTLYPLAFALLGFSVTHFIQNIQDYNFRTDPSSVYESLHIHDIFAELNIKNKHSVKRETGMVYTHNYPAVKTAVLASASTLPTTNDEKLHSMVSNKFQSEVTNNGGQITQVSIYGVRREYAFSETHISYSAQGRIGIIIIKKAGASWFVTVFELPHKT